jgi:hypothetical protein
MLGGANAAAFTDLRFLSQYRCKRNFFRENHCKRQKMSQESLELCRAKWATDAVSYPAVVCPQPQAHVVSFIFQSGWGGACCEIQSVAIRGEDGQPIDTLIPDKWYLNPDLFPDSVSFPLAPLDRPGFIAIENGIAQKGVKRLAVMYDDQQVWAGEVPMGTADSVLFTVPAPIGGHVFQKPDILIFRSTKTVDFSLDDDP